MADDIKSIKANFLAQKERFERTKKAIFEAERLIIETQGRLESLNKNLPEYERYYTNSRAKYLKLGSAEKQDRLSKMASLKEELERLSGQKVHVVALEVVTELDCG